MHCRIDNYNFDNYVYFRYYLQFFERRVYFALLLEKVFRLFKPYRTAPAVRCGELCLYFSKLRLKI